MPALTVRRHLRRRCAALAAAVAAIAAVGDDPPQAAAGTQERLERTQGRLADARAGLERARSRTRLLTGDLDAYNARIASTQHRIGALGSQIDEVQADLSIQSRRLEQLERALREQRARALRLQRRLGVARARLADRLVELYQADRPDLVGVVLSADGFNELLEREHFLSRIAASDRSIIGAVRDARAQAAGGVRRLAPLQARQRQVTQRIASRGEQLAAAKLQLVDARTALRSAAQEKRLSLRELRSTVSSRTSDVRVLAADEARLQRRLRAAQAASNMPAATGNGSMSWPVTGQLTSPFCETRSWEACHPGLDIAAPTGTPIRAAAAGQVILVQGEGSSGGYGNFTCVQHSSSLTSCYAHQSRTATSVGARVRRGDVIGYVGSTGRSTGPHLHWEVRVNGQVRSPLEYL